MWQPDWAVPKRILIAGCGTGSEAFAFRRRFPNAEITGIDFSSRSIKIARKLQDQSRSRKKIRFLHGDIAKDQLNKITGGKFDLISCHGVLSYIPRPERALDNLADCMRPNGAMYLGVNGIEHFSEKWRRSLSVFGFNLNSFEDGLHLRKILKLHDALTGNRIGAIANRGPEYLASDLFGAMISNRSLAHWSTLCRRSGFYLLGSYLPHRFVRHALNNDLYDLFVPRSRAEVHEVIEQIAPSSFHYLVFGRRPETNPPWLASERLKRCRVFGTKIYPQHWPKRTNSWRRLRQLTIRSKPTNTLVELRVPEWVAEILRQSSTGKSVSVILAEAPAISAQSVRKHLYLLYLLALINLRPPP
jgi:SAM-dependent methyltransferase